MSTSTRNRLFWSAAGYAALPAIAPYYAWRMMRSRKYRAGLRQRLALYTPDEKLLMADQKYIWFHTVSVGELQAARPLLHAVKQAYPQYNTWVTTVTETGQNLAKQLDAVDAYCYLPLDAPLFCNKFFNHFHPLCCIIFETELWPSLIHTAHQHEIPLYMVNGRLSDKSFGNYQRAKALFAPVLNCFDAILAQSRQDAERFAAIGADSSRVMNVGNIKFEAAKPQADHGEAAKWRSLLGLQDNELLLVAGSTFSGEELLFAQIAKEIRQQYPLKLLIAPRHIDRVSSIVDELQNNGFTVSLRSKLNEHTPSTILLLDTIGELKSAYSAADMVFIGKSLLEKGGQNPLEPASWGKPIVFGPHMQNFRDISAMLLKADGSAQVNDAAELQSVLMNWCGNPQLRQQTGQNALRVVNDNQGALTRIIQVLTPILEKHRVA